MRLFNCFGAAVAAALLAGTTAAHADTLVLKDGTTLENCFVRDEGVRLLVWEKMADVGTPRFRIIPRSQVAVDPIKVERDASWDAHPDLPDLTVAFVEITPKLPGLHWMIQYDELGTPTIKGPGKTLTDLGDEGNRMHPEQVVARMKLKYEPGEELTLTANIRNVGFKTAKPFEYIWLIDGKQIGKGKVTTSLKELEWTKVSTRYKWQEGMHTASFKITTTQPEIAVINNEITDSLWAWGITYVLNPKRTKHDLRTAYGTFCFEDYYRWHLDITNVLFAATVFPTSPDGVKARVRLDRIIYTDNPNGDNNVKVSTGPDGFGELQAMWTWTDSPEEIAHNWPTGREIRDSTEWSLPHELAHQLGIPDWYAQDNGGSPEFVWADNGEPVRHLMNHPNTMQHNHGPVPWNEVDAMYWNTSWDKPRGYYADYLFAIPDENFLSIVDVNGLPVEGAKVEVFQRGITVDPNGKTVVDHGVTPNPANEVTEDSVNPSKYPVMVTTTGKDGIMRMPNRPVREVFTLNGFHRKPNPFGNIDCVGTRGQLLVRVTKSDIPCYYWLDAFNFNEAWVRGYKDKNTIVLKTPYRSTGSPVPPGNVQAAKVDADHVRITWAPPIKFHEQQYVDKVIGYKVFRRVGPMGLNDRPWFEVGTFNADARECVIDLKQRPMDNDGYSDTERYAVASLGELTMASELIQAPMEPFKK
ncbi:MAG TPA: fibronectin type III domain-containing protein [Armatimonadota bacterium]|jgi:hypothetical protein